ncbi:MAG: hypothetical protein EP330_07185 [Deltaproteobacteria bacterium]|nr:MAG: hypothetical protein EP330_07185 [Deltaproteobacteria bacterium]
MRHGTWILLSLLSTSALADPGETDATDAPVESAEEATAPASDSEEAPAPDAAEAPAPDAPAADAPRESATSEEAEAATEESAEAPPTDDAVEDEPAEDEPAEEAAEAPAPPMPTSAPAPEPKVAHGTTPAEKVGRPPNKPLLYAAAGLGAATVVTYGLAAASYNDTFREQNRDYENFPTARKRTNALTAVSGGLAIATLGVGTTAFIVGEF